MVYTPGFLPARKTAASHAPESIAVSSHTHRVSISSFCTHTSEYDTYACSACCLLVTEWNVISSYDLSGDFAAISSANSIAVPLGASFFVFAVHVDYLYPALVSQLCSSLSQQLLSSHSRRMKYLTAFITGMQLPLHPVSPLRLLISKACRSADDMPFHALPAAFQAPSSKARLSKSLSPGRTLRLSSSMSSYTSAPASVPL